MSTDVVSALQAIKAHNMGFDPDLLASHMGDKFAPGAKTPAAGIELTANPRVGPNVLPPEPAPPPPVRKPLRLAPGQEMPSDPEQIELLRMAQEMGDQIQRDNFRDYRQANPEATIDDYFADTNTDESAVRRSAWQENRVTQQEREDLLARWEESVGGSTPRLADRANEFGEVTDLTNRPQAPKVRTSEASVTGLAKAQHSAWHPRYCRPRLSKGWKCATAAAEDRRNSRPDVRLHEGWSEAGWWCSRAPWPRRSCRSMPRSRLVI